MCLTELCTVIRSLNDLIILTWRIYLGAFNAVLLQAIIFEMTEQYPVPISFSDDAMVTCSRSEQIHNMIRSSTWYLYFSIFFSATKRILFAIYALKSDEQVVSNTLRWNPLSYFSEYRYARLSCNKLMTDKFMISN
jgi:hypothetical protein